MSDTTAPDEPQARRRGRGGVTVHDVARLAGVSIITVSRACNTPEQVSPQTLKRVRDVIAQLGYVPNLMAGGLRSARSKLVVALVPTLTSQLFARAIESLTEALDARGYQLMLGQIGYQDSREDRLLDAIIGRRPDGIVLTGVMHSPEGRRRLLASGIPLVETWDYTPTPIDMLVGFSHDRVGEEVCEFLVRHGRTRLALVSAGDERAMQRKAGFLRRAARLGIAEPRIALMPAPATHASGRAAVAALLDGGGDAAGAVDGIFCSSDISALGVMDELQSRGLGVPGQVAVVGFGDLEFAATCRPTLSTVRIDGERLGRTAAELIIARAEGRTPEARVIDIGFTLVERQSTAAFSFRP